MNEVLERKLTLTARDTSGQRKYAVRDLPVDTTVQDLVRSLVAKMGLPAQDSAGVPQAFHMFSEREGRHLQASETVGDALRDQDHVTLHPDVQAGASCLPAPSPALPRAAGEGVAAD